MKIPSISEFKFDESFWVQYFIFWILLRLIMCFFKTLAIRRKEFGKEIQLEENFCCEFKKVLSGFCYNDAKLDDYWLPALLGLFELFAYSILMKVGYYEPIGAWLALKTFHGVWSGYKDHRAPSVRFLFGNALILLFSFLLFSHINI